MKRYLPILAAAVLSCMVSCVKSEIQTFKLEDCSLSFDGIENSFSLRGWTEEYKDLHIPVKLLVFHKKQQVPIQYFSFFQGQALFF